eukprot:scaffold417890_cov40-Prasinocladus_malaysianus.AAC.2
MHQTNGRKDLSTEVSNTEAAENAPMVCLKVAPHFLMRGVPSSFLPSSAGTRMQHSTFRPAP